MEGMLKHLFFSLDKREFVQAYTVLIVFFIDAVVMIYELSALVYAVDVNVKEVGHDVDETFFRTVFGIVFPACDYEVIGKKEVTVLDIYPHSGFLGAEEHADGRVFLADQILYLRALGPGGLRGEPEDIVLEAQVVPAASAAYFLIVFTKVHYQTAEPFCSVSVRLQRLCHVLQTLHPVVKALYLFGIARQGVIRKAPVWHVREVLLVRLKCRGRVRLIELRLSVKEADASSCGVLGVQRFLHLQLLLPSLLRVDGGLAAEGSGLDCAE